MASISGSVPNLIGGISQQPAATRLENTAEDLQNALPSVVSGLRKRPPLNFIKDLGPGVLGNGGTVKLHVLDRPERPLKFVVYANDTIKVYDETGTEETVTVTGSAVDYLTESDPEKNVGFLTIGDVTFIYNRTKRVTASLHPETGSNRSFPGQYLSYVVEQSAIRTRYQISVNGAIVASAQSSDTSPGDVVIQAAGLFNNIGTGWQASLYSNTISLEAADPDDLIVGEPPSMARAYKDTISKFTNLPPYERDGRIVEISGEFEGDDRDSFYVVYKAEEGIWQETYGYGHKETLDAHTMPHVLVDNGDGTWEVKPWDWHGRVVGDSDTNPTPSFVGYPVKDMAIFGNRMCILADENLVMSEDGVFENFYRTTLTTLLDSDRIDIAVLTSDGRVATLQHMIGFAGSLLLFSDKDQFRVSTESGITPEALSVRAVSSYNCAPYAHPVSMGSNVAFVDDTDQSHWSHLREYYTDEISGTEDSDIITVQVPALVPSQVRKLITNPTAGMLAAFSKKDRTKLFIYSYHWSGNERIQSAWNYWKSLCVRFLDGAFVDSKIWLLVEAHGRLLLVNADLQETTEGDFQGVEVTLDMRVSQDQVTMTLENERDTLLKLPYTSCEHEDTYVVITGGTRYLPGESFKSIGMTPEGEHIFPEAILTEGDVEFLVGRSYEFFYELSPIYLRDTQKVPIQDGRFQLRYLSFLYHQTSFFRISVTPRGRGPFVQTFAGRLMGSLRNIVGRIGVDEGKFRVPVSARADQVEVTIQNDGPFGCRFSAIEWEGGWRPKSRRTNH